ncbi:GTP-binding protein [Dichotomicrobium thermohalophilum]|uniref:Probable GTP-binding protein EngB n=1 Tax=Dichotomicrobium thermohalophilum TaxID=933063 RepID=A0A397PK96_9HYPH|nr:ribosome biogenesis GTP-binding protein YihA/YsxC [Dichotomicrobium thermohalophilum]RIA47705.1 GTP-binding protein [Dichotomicrobium thermohalophilum]
MTADTQGLFSGPIHFIKGVVRIDGLPVEPLPEVAFAGRSNVGKSSLLNALTGRKALARTSNTPGRTRELNYFRVGDLLYIVDMPGYGYAKAPKSQVKGWNELIYAYLRGRPQLKRVFLLIDARHGIKNTDKDVLALMDEAAVSYQVVLTKIDKISAGQLKRVQSETAAYLAKHPAAHPDIIATSAQKRLGIDDLRAAIVELIAAGQV